MVRVVVPKKGGARVGGKVISNEQRTDSNSKARRGRDGHYRGTTGRINNRSPIRIASHRAWGVYAPSATQDQEFCLTFGLAPIAGVNPFWEQSSSVKSVQVELGGSQNATLFAKGRGIEKQLSPTARVSKWSRNVERVRTQ
ncbi:hypothetical protein EXIGLDRAFT_199082 [Exidia glandulosa HHB12029]|uniref:Uncharacterized protein n=1 Tax=Exidia glandulosa HHB12029 TaxID=1314781 RepID=A0A165MY07_EXIGL|nr:hypothetical protein EXIGLDRAFT_199082 [Exidia glandulosa HHB12029]